MSLTTFAGQALADIQSTAAIAPSSRFLGRAMVEPLRARDARVVVELGAGTGSITREVLEALPPYGLLLAFEISQPFVEHLRNTIVDERFEVIAAGAETAPGELRKRGISHIDGVVSSLGITVMDEEIVDAIFAGLKPYLDATSSITQYQYGSPVRIEDGVPVPFSVRDVLNRYFTTVDSRLIWRNIPPALVYECVGVREETLLRRDSGVLPSLYSRRVA